MFLLLKLVSEQRSECSHVSKDDSVTAKVTFLFFFFFPKLLHVFIKLRDCFSLHRLFCSRKWTVKSGLEASKSLQGSYSIIFVSILWKCCCPVLLFFHQENAVVNVNVFYNPKISGTTPEHHWHWEKSPSVNYKKQLYLVQLISCDFNIIK